MTTNTMTAALHVMQNAIPDIKSTMDQMSIGETAVVRKILPFPLRRRLQEIGLNPGSCVTCVGKSPLGDPVAYEICGAVIALRKNDASNISLGKVMEQENV